MKIVFVVNDFDTLVSTQATYMLMHRAAERGHDVWTVAVTDLAVQQGGGLSASARRVPGLDTPENIRLDDADLVMLRTNPARQPGEAAAHDVLLLLARFLEDRGVTVVNRPDGLWKASSKLYLASFPAEVVPESVVSRDPKTLRAFVEGRDGRTVLKPLRGTRGQDVFVLNGAGTPNLGQIIDVLVRQGPVIGQAWAEGAEQGDTRVLMVNGKPLIIDGDLCAVRRVPAKGDFRSNIHTGGHAEPGVMTPEIARACEVIGPILQRDGIYVAGLDLIGGLAIEVNVFSPGGLRDAEKFTGKDFVGAILQGCLSHVGSASSRP